jgi:hypothetical protein
VFVTRTARAPASGVSSRTHTSLSSASASRSDTKATNFPSGETRPCHSADASGVSRLGRPPPEALSTKSCQTPFGSRCENTIRSSRVHDGHRSSPAVVVTRRAAPPDAGAIQTSNSPFVSALKAIDLPSGDQLGSRSVTQSPGFGTSRAGFRPSGVIVHTASNQVTASRLPSGDQAASRTPVGPEAAGGSRFAA